jgi:hypothetical protein
MVNPRDSGVREGAAVMVIKQFSEPIRGSVTGSFFKVFAEKKILQKLVTTVLPPP